MDTGSRSRIKKPMPESLSGTKCNGVMGVPITFLDKYNPDQFEIVGISKTWATDYEVKKTKIYKAAHQHNKGGNIIPGSKINDGGAIALSQNPRGIYYTDDNENGKYLIQVYARIFIKRKLWS